MPRTPRHARTTALVTAAGLLALTACAPSMTINAYSPSDGTRVDLTGALRGVNLLVLSPEEGAEGLVQGALANHTDEPVTFTLTTEGTAPVEVEVGASSTVLLGGEDGEEVLLDTVAKAPGTFLDATLEADGESLDFHLPVLDDTLPEYGDSVPQS